MKYIKVLERSLSLDPTKLEISHLLQGLKKQKEGLMQESIKFFKRALREFGKFGNLGGRTLCYGYIAISLDHMNEPHKSINYYQRACRLLTLLKI